MRHSHASQKYQTEHAQVGEAIADQCVDGRDATRGEARQKDGFIGCERIRGRQQMSGSEDSPLEGSRDMARLQK